MNRLVSAVVCVFLLPGFTLGQPRYTRAQEDQFHRAVTTALAHGAYDDARQIASERDASDPSAAALLARLDILGGDYIAAETRLTPVAAANPVSGASLELALLQQYLGRREEAIPQLQVLVSRLRRSTDPLDLYQAALAARALGDHRLANGLLRSASRASPDDPAIQTLWGELFGEKYDQAEASRSFSDALALDEEWAPAYLGMARALADTNPPAARSAAGRALDINPNYLEAHLFLAQRDLDDREHDVARQSLHRALEINGQSLEARSLLAAIAYVEDRIDDFESEVEEVLQINPAYGEVFRQAGNLTARNYRFEEAASLVRRGLELDPNNSRSNAELGMHLLRTGDEQGARLSLERAFDVDPYDVVTFNLLEMLDTLDEFETFEQSDLIVKLHPDEAPVLKNYVFEVGQRAFDELAALYEFTPEGPILIEVFPQHDHFAVRTLGLPGMIGALGACFGKVVTLDSPRARTPGEFNWESTLWHEMAHVIALQMSNQRVPRWLTEGLSTFEQKRARSDWARDQDLGFAADLNQDTVLSLRDLNSGFSSPETISMAYFQASVLVEHIIDFYGESVIYRLLRAYGQGLDTEEALELVGLGFEVLQASFDSAVEDRFGALRRAMQGPEDQLSVREPTERLEQLRGLSGEYPGSFPVQLSLGQALKEAGEIREAQVVLEKAASLAPMATGGSSPYIPLAEIAIELGDRNQAIEQLAAHLDHDHRDIDAARQLAALAEEVGDGLRLRRAYELIIELDPFDVVPHQALGRLALASGEHGVAVREFEVALAVGPVDRVSAHVDLAESYFLEGQLDPARQEVIAALEIAPTYERAQELLLQIIEEGL
ncbi:MAG: hypothetical protein CL484_04895 [Acidobacteria bacterium]|nr:hypothetical protein [Acidobacteriota bacterium]